MSRHCLYCAKELPKGATNNFCSKECWTEYKKLKAMDVGTDKQATVLLKRSELAEGEFKEEFAGTEEYQDTADQAAVGRSDRSEADVFEDAVPAEPVSAGRGSSARKTPTEITSISERLSNLEVLLNEKLGQDKGDAQGLLNEIARKVEDALVRQNKLEVDMEKVDAFLRSVDKFEDRLRRIERQVQSIGSIENTVKKSFFARLFS